MLTVGLSAYTFTGTQNIQLGIKLFWDGRNLLLCLQTKSVSVRMETSLEFLVKVSRYCRCVQKATRQLMSQRICLELKRFTTR